MPKFKTGDRVRIIRGREDTWYNHHIGYEYTIAMNPTTLHERVYWYINEKPNHTIHASDIELVTEGETMTKEITTNETILHLQSLVDLTGDDVEIIIRENDLFVQVFDKHIYCENADVLEEAAKAAAFLSRQEIV